MTDIKEKIADPFAELDAVLNDLENNDSDSPFTETAQIIENKQEEINKVAEENNFGSRQPIITKSKHVRKTYTLYPEHVTFIKSSLNEYENLIQTKKIEPSKSDVVRAALESFKALSPSERATLIHNNIARNR